MRPLVGACCLFLAGLVLSSPTVSADAQEVVRHSGNLDVLWHGEAGHGNECTPIYSLAADSGERIRLQSGASGSGSWIALVGKRVTVTASPAPADRNGDGAGLDSLRVQSLEPDASAQLDGAGVAQGVKKYLTLLCRFADLTNNTPESKRYYERMFSDRRYGIISHFQRASYGALSLQGSRVVGWLNLPQPQRAYGTGLAFDSDQVLFDAVEAASSQVAVRDFDGINLVFNAHPFGQSVGGWGGRRTLNLDGVSKSYGVTWLAYSDQALFVHEMGHTLGLPHSSGPYSKTYDSRWDVMSSPYEGKRARFGYIAQDTIAYHKRLLGWIPEGARVTVAPGTQTRLTLKSLCNVKSSCYLIEIPLDSTGKRLYTIEVRQRQALDRFIPGTGAVLHFVDSGRSDRVATVVDIDNNGNPNDAASRWLPGEEFQDATNGIRIAVIAGSGPSLTVDVSNKAGR